MDGAGKTTTVEAAPGLLEMQGLRLRVVTPTVEAARVAAQEPLGANASDQLLGPRGTTCCAFRGSVRRPPEEVLIRARTVVRWIGSTGGTSSTA